MVAGIVWWQSDWFIALGALLLGFVVFGIVRSKLHNDAIPLAQREYSYSDYAIVTWYFSRYYCFTSH
jgi:nitrate/TMAO reductase-like tetraheme cytochrome c subunit